MKKGNRKFGQVALAGVIAFGGLGVGAVADIPIPGFKAEQAEAAMLYQHIDFIIMPRIQLTIATHSK